VWWLKVASSFLRVEMSELPPSVSIMAQLDSASSEWQM
jgi:hypothetical protein